MTKKTTHSKKILTIIACVLLWITRGMFFYLEVSPGNNYFIYTLLGVLSVSVFALALFGVDPTIVFAVNVAGFLGIIIVYSIVFKEDGLVWLTPVVCFAPLLFLNNHYQVKSGEEKQPFVVQFGEDFFRSLPFVLLALIFYGAQKRYYYFELSDVYFLFIGIVVAALYFFSAKTKSDLNSNNKGKMKSEHSRRSFLFAAVLIVESSVYCIIYQSLLLAGTFILLWLLVFILLCEFKHPVCVNALETLKSGFMKFLK